MEVVYALVIGMSIAAALGGLALGLAMFVLGPRLGAPPAEPRGHGRTSPRHAVLFPAARCK